MTASPAGLKDHVGVHESALLRIGKLDAHRNVRVSGLSSG
jgi:hypothetical protein